MVDLAVSINKVRKDCTILDETVTNIGENFHDESQTRKELCNEVRDIKGTLTDNEKEISSLKTSMIGVVSSTDSLLEDYTLLNNTVTDVATSCKNILDENSLVKKSMMSLTSTCTNLWNETGVIKNNCASNSDEHMKLNESVMGLVEQFNVEKNQGEVTKETLNIQEEARSVEISDIKDSLIDISDLISDLNTKCDAREEEEKNIKESLLVQKAVSNKLCDTAKIMTSKITNTAEKCEVINSQQLKVEIDTQNALQLDNKISSQLDEVERGLENLRNAECFLGSKVSRVEEKIHNQEIALGDIINRNIDEITDNLCHLQQKVGGIAKQYTSISDEHKNLERKIATVLTKCDDLVEGFDNYKTKEEECEVLSDISHGDNCEEPLTICDAPNSSGEKQFEQKISVELNDISRKMENYENQCDKIIVMRKDFSNLKQQVKKVVDDKISVLKHVVAEVEKLKRSHASLAHSEGKSCITPLQLYNQ